MQIKEYEQILKKNQFNGYKLIASALVQSQDWKASAISLSDFLNKISSASSINNLLDKEKVESLFMDLNKYENKTIEPVSKSISE